VNDKLTAFLIGPRPDRQMKMAYMVAALMFVGSLVLFLVGQVAWAIACWPLIGIMLNLTALRVWWWMHLAGYPKPSRSDVVLTLLNIAAVAMCVGVFVSDLRDLGVL
jgi:hypothetical protein